MDWLRLALLIAVFISLAVFVVFLWATMIDEIWDIMQRRRG